MGGPPESRRSYVDAAWGQVHLREAGDGARHLLLLHQVPSSAAMWEPVLRRFVERGYHAIALDLPGYGMSDPPPQEPDLQWYAAAVHEVLARRGWLPLAVVGHHTGASVALQLAVDRPDDVAALALWGIGLLDEAMARQLADEAAPVYDAEGAELMRFWSVRRTMSGPVADAVATRALAEALLAGVHKPDGHRAVGRADHAVLLRAVRQPLLGLAGDREMLREETRQAVALARNGRYEHLGDTGIDVADEDPLGFVDAVDRFLSAVRR